jgi:hypothetical protein
MPKPMYVWSGSAWVSVASEVESLAGFATQSYADNTPGARLVVPTSVAVGSGSGSVGTSGAVTFSGASSVSLNNCFTSTYKTYRITFEILGSGIVGVNFRLRTSGTDASGANYQRQSLAAYSTTVATSNTTTGTTFGIGNAITSYYNFMTMDIQNPQIARNTSIINHCSSYDPVQIDLAYGFHTLTTSYDGFTVYPSSGTLSGTICVYGMKN